MDHRPQTKVHGPHLQRAQVQLSSIITPATGDQLIKHTVIRKQIAEHMVASKQTSPHVLTVMEADMSRVAKHRSATRRFLGEMGSISPSQLIL